GLDSGHEREEGLRLGGDVDELVSDGVVEGLDAEAVACAKEQLPLLVPDHEGEHSSQMVDAALAPAGVGLQDDLRVRGRPEEILAELLTKLDVVVDLAVV